MENNANSFAARFSHWLRISLLVKLTSIGIIVLLLLIPSAMIQSLIYERQGRKEQVVREISQSWGGIQSVTGPVLSIPYVEWQEEEKGKKTAHWHTLHILPQELHIKGDAQHEIRRKGIFDAVLYRSELTLSGKFDKPAVRELNIAPEDIRWGEARLSVGISSMTGIKNIIELEWNGQKQRMEPGTATKLLGPGVSVPVSYSIDAESFAFSIPLKLNGTDALYFEPVGRLTTAQLKATWPSPGFVGRILPDKRNISARGFDAQWKILDVNRHYPQQWKDLSYRFKPAVPLNTTNEDGDSYTPIDDEEGDAHFGVRLVLPVNEYLKNDRTVKYAILTIGLTFLIYFFFEALHRFQIHPFQYLLVGLALTVFYLLLLSLSEQFGFDVAYGIAASATIGLIAFYSASILKIKPLVIQLTLLLCAIYGFIFVVLQLEDYALLAGSIGIFIALAAVMYYSRKVDWYNLGRANHGERTTQ